MNAIEKIGLPDTQLHPDEFKGFNAQSMSPTFLRQVADGMEQGVLVWSPEAVCIMYTDRVFDVLELRRGDIKLGMRREDFLAGAIERGELEEAAVKRTQEKFQRKTPFQFDRKLRSGRIVSTAARPMETGGFVVTFTDVTKQRKESADLDDAKRSAEAAQQKMFETLANEKQRQREVKVLAELGDWLQTCKSLEELYTVLKEYLTNLFPGSNGELYIYSNSRDVLDGVVRWGSSEIHEHIKADACWALRRGRNYSHLPGEISFSCNHVCDQSSYSPDDYICVPIIAHGDTVGLLHIQFGMHTTDAENVRDPHQFAAQCGELISLAIANVKLRDELHDQSTKDHLTGLYNRRFFMEALRNELSLQRRKGGKFGVISFDADKFKTFNDNHGHDAGDMVLRLISDTMLEQFRDDEILCRYGGEEFSVLLPGATKKITLEAADAMRERLQNGAIPYAGRVLPAVTISLGVASFPECGEDVQTLLKRADDALYKAKDLGRNCLVDAKTMKVWRRKA